MDINLLIEKLRNINDEEVWTKMLSVEQLAKDAAWELQKVASKPDLIKENADIRKEYSNLKSDLDEYKSICKEYEVENENLITENQRLRAENFTQEEQLQNDFDAALRYEKEEIRARYLKEIFGDFTFDTIRGYIVDLIKEETKYGKALQS